MLYVTQDLDQMLTSCR